MWDALLAADGALGAQISAALVTTPLALPLVWLSAIGAKGGLWILLGAIAWVAAPRKRMGVWRLLLALGLTGLLTDALFKPLVGRERPLINRPEIVLIGDRPDTASFPSGHAGSASAGAVSLSRIWPAFTLPIWALALTVALSRVVLAVHFPIDVLAGLLLGYAVARFVCARPPEPDAPVGGSLAA